MTAESPVVRPEDLLPDSENHAVLDGVTVRKGTVGAFVVNARAALAATPDSIEHAALIGQLRELLPAMEAIGVLEIFELRSPALRESLGITS